jgi:hypothetical protein
VAVTRSDVRKAGSSEKKILSELSKNQVRKRDKNKLI